MAVDRNYILDKMRGKMMTPDQFNFDMLQAPPLMSLLSPTDIGDLNSLATSIRYSGNPILRLQKQDEILKRRGFRKFTGGTNRVVYKFLEDDSFLIKVASDAVGVGDSPREWINQIHYKPFITKVFEVSPCGTVGLFERVIPITSRDEFLSVASDIFDVINNWFIGEYVMDDIGTDFFMNWGLRKGFGPVLLDFPYSYKLDGNKLYCNVPSSNETTHICGGVIDYDEGFNHLRCTKCGAIYKAKELENAVKNETVIIKGGRTKMKVSFGYENSTKVVKDTVDFTDTAPKLIPKKTGKKSKIGKLKVSIPNRNDVDKKENNNSGNNRGKVIANGLYSKPDDDSSEITKNSKIICNDDNIDNAKLHIFKGEITNTKDLTGGELNETNKCIVLTDDNGNLVTIDGGYIIINNILNKPISEISLLTKEAHEDLINTIDTLNSRIKELNVKNMSVTTSLNELQARYDNLLEEKEYREDLEDNLPYTIDSKGRKRDKKSGKFLKSDEDLEFDTRSPLLSSDDKDEVSGTEIQEYSDEEDCFNDTPVGAAPPKNKPEKYNQNSHKK